jgi:hypothetical protein
MKKLMIVILLLLIVCFVRVEKPLSLDEQREVIHSINNLESEEETQIVPIIKDNNYIEYMGKYYLKRIEHEKIQRVERYPFYFSHYNY